MIFSDGMDDFAWYSDPSNTPKMKLFGENSLLL